MKTTEKYGSCREPVQTCLMSPGVSSRQWSALIIMIMWVCSGVPFITLLLVTACAASSKVPAADIYCEMKRGKLGQKTVKHPCASRQMCVMTLQKQHLINCQCALRYLDEY